MANYDTFVLFGAVYENQAAAELDYEAVKSLYYDWQLIDNFDAALVAKRDDGKVKILKKHEQPTRKGGWRGAGIGLATGAVIALFPQPRSAVACSRPRPAPARPSAPSPATWSAA